MYFTDDPARDAERWEDEKKRTRQVETCDLCGDYIVDYYYEIDGDKVCECCLDRLFKHDVGFL